MKQQDPDIHPTGKHSAFYTAQKHLDTVVFVHGLGGHFHKTWGKFPELLTTDPNLPRLDVYLWGYRTGAMLPLVSDKQTVGGELISDLVVQFQEDNALHLVGHSMGGLIILEGLVAEMVARRAQQKPANCVGFISLFASPVSGSTAAAMVKQTLGKLWGLRALVNRQIASLARGKGVDDLLTEVMHRIYEPIPEDSAGRSIPIRMIMARRDKAVSENDRQRTSARYRKQTPLEFDYGHSAIKEPRDRDDQRYKALTNDVHDGFATRLQQICIDLKSIDTETRNHALGEFSRRYEHIVRRRLEDAGVVIEKNPALYRSYLRVILDDCRRSPRPLFYAADRALTILTERGELGR